MTTTTASVVPAPRPATQGFRASAGHAKDVGAKLHTEENVAETGRARFLVREPALVSFERREANGHFGYDAGEDRAETLVECERGLAARDHDTCGNEAARFGLWQAATLQGDAKGLGGKGTHAWCPP